MIRVSHGTGAAVLVLATGLGLGLAQPALAEPGHQAIDTQWAETDTTPTDGLGLGCPAFVGTLEEHLIGSDIGFLAEDGVAHVRTRVNATVELMPADPNQVTYVGSYSMDQTGTYPSEGAGTKAMTRTVHGAILGNDGSTFRISEVLHLNTDGQGRTRATFDHLTCH